MEKYTISLEKDIHLKSVYQLYIIKITNNGDELYYIGQTGDNNYVTARPALLRLAGHLDFSYHSTQNQVYKGIARHLQLDAEHLRNPMQSATFRHAMEQFLSSSTIQMHVYPLAEFNYHADRDTEHRHIVKQIQKFEKQVIAAFRNSNKLLLNVPRSSKVTNEDMFPGKLQIIRQKFSLS